MADDASNEDQWLYGESNSNSNEINESNVANDPNKEEETKDSEADGELTENHLSLHDQEILPPGVEINDNLQDGEIDDQEREGNDNAEDDEDDSDDDVNVVIGDIKTTPTYSSLNIKRGGLLTSTVAGEKLKQQPGKFSIDEFEAIGTINGIPSHDFNLDSLEDKPWRKPGADITDYFNYGFNEDTWRAYCERQKRIRVHESGVGLSPMIGPGKGMIVPIMNDNSKYSGFLGPKKAGPPPGRKMGGSIDVIGMGGLASRRGADKGTPPKENAIQVLTADRREYSRKPQGFPDMSVPPPAGGISGFEYPPPSFGAPPPVENYGEFYPGDPDPYYQSYEPTQDSQWDDPTWQQEAPLAICAPEVKVLTHGSDVVSGAEKESNHDSQDGFNSHSSNNRTSSRGQGSLRDDRGSTPSMDERERKDRKDKDRHRDRSHRHRSRSRSPDRRRRHKSHSRSPGHRSHRKKKSRRSEREKSKDDSS